MTEPSRRDRTRPAEVLGLSAALALFVGIAVLASTRDWLLAVEFFAVAFIVSIVVFATLLIAAVPREPGAPDDHVDP